MKIRDLAASKIEDKRKALEVDMLAMEVPTKTPSLIEDESYTPLKRVKSPVINYEDIRHSRTDWEGSEFDFDEIDKFADIEPYVLQSFLKKEALFIKEGYDIVGENPENVNYIKKRMAQIAYVSGISERQLIQEIGKGLRRVSNRYIALVRKTQASGGYPYRDPRTGKMLEPIAAMFPLPAARMEVKVNKLQHPVKYRQYMPGQEKLQKVYTPENIVHIYTNKRDGYTQGTPRILPALEDIKALRRLEENVEILVHQSIFPIVHYKIGSKELPGRPQEINETINEIISMPTEGMFVSSERHEIKMIGTEGRALRVEAYMEYFKKRVLAGLSLSSVDIGEGGTSNRNTADTMSRAVVDEVKADQKTVEDFFNNEILCQLLLESGQNIDITDPSQKVFLRFREIDYDTKIKKENHTIQKWLQDGISHEEYRQELGYNVMSEEELGRTRTHLITIPSALTSGAGDPGSAISYAAASSPDTPIEQEHINKASKQAEAAQKQKAAQSNSPSGGTVANRARPSNQHGTKTGPSKSLKDSLLISDSEIFNIKSNLPLVLSSTGSKVMDLSILITENYMQASSRVRSIVNSAYKKGCEDAGYFGMTDRDLLNRKAAQDNAEKYVKRLFSDIEKEAQSNKNVEDITFAIDSIEYRLKFIENTESIRAYNWGYVKSLEALGESVYNIDMGQDTNPGKVVYINKDFEVQKATIQSIPPFHPNSTMTIKRKA